jgi:hypothetical protein
VDEDIVVPVVAILSIFVFFPLAVAFARYIWRRSSMPPEPRNQASVDEMARRMAELQHSMDAMAIEIERISEGQRFITKVMSERPVAEIPAQAPAARQKR